MVLNHYLGKFIVLEWIDKAGKDTQLYFIEKYLKDKIFHLKFLKNQQI